MCFQKGSDSVKVFICEDEQVYLKQLQKHIKQWAQSSFHQDTQLTSFASSEDLLENWRKGNSADILFLDILFNNEMNGVEIAKEIRKMDNAVTIVFVTSSETFAKDGYSVRAFRYLIKPVCYDDVALCLNVAYKQYTLAHNEFLIINNAGERIAVRYNEILFIEAQSPHILLHMQGRNDSIKIRCRLSDVKPKLPEELFVQCHRSYIVNIVHVRSIRRNTVTVSSGQELPLSRSLAADVNNAFDNYYQGGGSSYGMDSF